MNLVNLISRIAPTSDENVTVHVVNENTIEIQMPAAAEGVAEQ